MSQGSIDLRKEKVVAIYVRVSTQEQAKHGHSLEAQYDAIKAHLKKLGIKFYRIYRDPGFSAKDLHRPALQKLLSDASNHKFIEVYVWRFDRLSRKTIDLLEIVEYFKACEIILKSITEPFVDWTTPMGDCLLGILGSFSQMERQTLISRVKLGIQRKREQGLWLGTAPFGYTYNEKTKTLIINSKESKAVTLIFEKYLELGTISAVKNHLNDNNIKPRIAQKWGLSSVGGVLSRKLYTGTIQIGDTEREDEPLRIIPDELFQECQIQRQEQRNLSPKLKEVPITYEKEGCFCYHCGWFCSVEMTFCKNCGTRVQT